MDLSQDFRPSSTIRSFNGCWTCRLRRKKCDEAHPVCTACAALHIPCFYQQDKPEWMDGGVRQEEIAERLKREIKEKAYRRRGERAVRVPTDRIPSTVEVSTSAQVVLNQNLPKCLPSPICALSSAASTQNDGMEPHPKSSTTRAQSVTDCSLAAENPRKSRVFESSDTILLVFYLEHVLPFLFPFYCPSPLQGGRAWVLEMMMDSPVVRQATLCQSSYFFSLARGSDNDGDTIWETVLAQTRDAFGMLRQALQVIGSTDIAEHLHGAVRILASIMQVQRFEIAVLSFANCQPHLNAALALFKLLLDSAAADKSARAGSSFSTVLDSLGPTAFILPAQSAQVPSGEHAAFRFSSALLILDDIIASTALQEKPRLYECHRSLLSDINGAEPLIDLEAVVGCQNWVLLQIGEIAVLDSWKQQCKRAGNLDVMEMVRRATAIKDSLEAHLTRLESDPVFTPGKISSLLDVFRADHGQHSEMSNNQSSSATRVWAHAALLYLFVVVSGWQPVSVDVRYHVGRIIELLTHQISPPALLRTMVWPFCVAGCLAEPAQETHLRGMVEALQPPSVFGTVRKALEIMENIWRNRNAGDSHSRDLATCFRSQGDLVLLV